MFSGIISSLSLLQKITKQGSGLRFTFSNPIAQSFKIDQSVSHDGVCLTVVAILGDQYEVEVIAETLSKTTLGSLREGTWVNIETSITPATLLDGHIVQGHVDSTLKCIKKEDLNGSWSYWFHLPEEFAHLVIPHGSVCLNGVSLTVANIVSDSFNVAIIPYTFTHTNFQSLEAGMAVNVEFDILGKYLARKWSLEQK